MAKKAKKNFGTGYGYLFHGAFSKKEDAQAKEAKTPGSFVRGKATKHGYRYFVMTPRQNPPRKRRKKPKPNPSELVIFGNPKRKPARKPRRRRANVSPLAKAKALFQKFHGRGASGVYGLDRAVKARKDYSILGPLVAIGTNAEKFDQIRPAEDQVVEHWDKLPHMAFLNQAEVNQVMRIIEEPERYLKNVTLLAASPNGKQLYVISNGPLELDLSAYDTDASKDLVDLGDATFVVYVAKKPSDPKEWVHTFGEEGGSRPRVYYDRLNKGLLFGGGSYHVDAPGIVN